MPDPAEPQSPLENTRDESASDAPTTNPDEEARRGYPSSIGKGAFSYGSPPPPDETGLDEASEPPLSYGLAGDDGKTPG